MSGKSFRRIFPRLLVSVACVALFACAANREVATPTPVIVGRGGDTALDGAMTTWVRKQAEKAGGLQVVSEPVASAIYVQFSRNVLVTGNRPDQQAEYQVNYRRSGIALGQRVGSCDLGELHDCADQIVADVLKYASSR
jgi:hypothetical protein